MTKETNGNAPDLIVLGPDDDGKPRAGRFPASQADLVAKAAKAMNLTVCKAEGAALAELAKKLTTGRLYGTGRGFVPPVNRNLYGKIVEQLKLAGQPVPRDADQSACRAARPGVARHLGRHCRRSPGDRPGRDGRRLVGGHHHRPGRRHAHLEMAGLATAAKSLAARRGGCAVEAKPGQLLSL
jgi:hypothetical protein